MSSLDLPPVNRASDPFLCNHGVKATFAGELGDEITLSLLCELAVGHTGSHWAEGAGHWIDEDL